MNWTPPAERLLTQLDAEKKSFGRIEEIMRENGFDVTRNSCIGKARRLGLEPRKSIEHVSKRKSRTRAVGKKQESLPPAPEVLTTDPVVPLPVAKPVLFMKAENHHCHFPLWTGDEPITEKWFCGTPTANVLAGRPYCTNHTHFIATAA